MAKNVVICLDGTWNKPDEPGAEVSRETNVRNLWEMCVNDGARQVTYYDEGVGSHWYDRIRGGISGRGLSKNVREAYAELCARHDPGDKVFLFGFSRGAFTARSVGGMVYSCGLIPRPRLSGKTVDEAFEVYREGDKGDRAAYKAANGRDCPVEVVGVWDTVGALGIPVGFLKKFTDRHHQFHDTKLNGEVTAAYHAVSIDEERDSFTPTLFRPCRRRLEGQVPDQVIEQVWFAGVHSDVGGGYPERQHSDIAFRWMVERAKGHGLRVEASRENAYGWVGNPAAPIHDSYRPYYGFRTRRVADARDVYKPMVHRSVLQKIQANGYRPLALVDVEDWATLAPYRLVG